MGAEVIILANPYTYDFLKGLTHSAVEGENLTLKRREDIFEKFYGCFFGKYFRNSNPPISLQQFVQQSMKAAIDSDEKVKKKETSPAKLSPKFQVPSAPCVSWICHPSLNLLRTPVHGFQVFTFWIFRLSSTVAIFRFQRTSLKEDRTFHHGRNATGFLLDAVVCLFHKNFPIFSLQS